MLIVSRKTGQAVVARGQNENGPKIIVRILEIKGTRIKVGIEAPEGVVIIRDELEHKPRPTGRPAA